MEEAYGNCGMSDETALISLVNDALERETARMHNVVVTEQEINAFRKYVDENTKAPEILEKVKRVFGDDRASYEQIYLGPKIINRKLDSWYSRNTEIHKHERAAIEKVYSLAQSGKSLAEAAQAQGLDYSTTEYHKGHSSIPASLKGYRPRHSESPTDGIAAIVGRLSEGEIYRNIVEDDYGYQVMRLLQKNGTEHKLEAVTAKKRPFRKWFLEQAGQIDVRILDGELGKEVTAKYPSIWWVRECCQN
ncbi:MAG: hypothetical protein JSU70_05895 [Phycisphaerales bacterium]|nr:MAG: hypothetical protein JSU70_05895 [Phycisphaerales bacterium]